MNKQIRNIIIFSVIAVGCGFLGMIVDSQNPPPDPMQGLGTLIWLVSPLLVNIILRTFLGGGWKNFGLKPNFKEGWKYYLISLGAIPLITLTVVGVGILFNTDRAAGGGKTTLEVILPLMGMMFVSSMMKNIFEEFSWRGYLTPKLAEIGVHPFLNSAITGIVWAGWHIPYYLYFLDRATLESHTALSLPVFIGLAFVLLVLQAFAYGELRLASKSLWPVWIMHNTANAISLTLLSGNIFSVSKGFWGVFLSPGSEGILYSVLMGLLGFALYRSRIKKNHSS